MRLKHYYLGDKEISEAEAKEIETKNREALLEGTIEELLQTKPITVKEEILHDNEIRR